jgi:hypothetical protein
LKDEQPQTESVSRQVSPAPSLGVTTSRRRVDSAPSIGRARRSIWHASLNSLS